MTTWATVQADVISEASRWDAEFFVNGFNDYLTALFSRGHACISLRDASIRLTSGHTPLRHDVSQGDTPFITVECVNPLGLDLEKAKRVWSRHALGELSRVRVNRGDILITIKRRIAISCPILTEPGLMVVNQDVVVMTPKPGLRSAYIAAVLNSRVGQFQARRHATEQMNPYINVTKLGQLLIPRLSDSLQRRIEIIVQERLKALEQSSSYYREAEAELLERMGWEQLRRQAEEFFYFNDFVNLSERSDAEFFQPRYVRIRDDLKNRGAQTVGSFCPKPSRGVQPLLASDGNVVVVDSKAVRPLGVEPAPFERASPEFYRLPQNAKARLRCGDVLLNSTGRGTLGRASVYQFELPGLCDNHVTILRPDPAVCVPLYLALFLNSPPGLAQSEQFQTGSSGQLEIYPEHIQQFLIFLPQQRNGSIDLKWQERLAAKLEAASSAQATAKVKLEESHRLVAQLVDT